jgi:hypothetical protein
MEPFDYPDTAGRRLKITRGRGTTAWLTIDDHGSTRGVELEKSAVPGAAAALYEATGLPAPLILPRPLDLPIGTSEHNTAVAGYYLWLENGRVCTDERELEQGIEPGDAWLLAAAIAVHAEAAVEPDQDEVDRLAAAIHGAQCNTSVVPDPCDRCREVARLVLRGGWKREPGQ